MLGRSRSSTRGSRSGSGGGGVGARKGDAAHGTCEKTSARR